MNRGKAGTALKNLLDRVTGVSLFVKVMGIALSLIMLFGIGTIIETRSPMRDSVKRKTQERGRLLALYIGSSLTNRLITGDFVAVSEHLKGAVKIYSDVKYLFVLSPQRRVLVVAPAFAPSRELVEANAAGADGFMGEQFLEAGGEIICDVAAPLMGGRLGTLRIGISQDSLRRTVNAMTARLAMSVLLTALVGAGLSWLLAFILNKPIYNLMKGVERVESGDFTVSVRPWFSDEIGRLTAAFNNMTAVLGREKTLKTELMRKLITSQEDERQRISRELHDKTSQSLTSIKIGLKVLEADYPRDGAGSRLEEFRTLLNNSLEEIHDLAVELRPPALADFGLPRVVEELGRNFEKTLGVKFECAVDGYFRDHRFAPAVEIGLYRIIQEAFSNIEKHSGAGVVRVGFAKTDGEMLITVKDNGRGFDPVAARTRPDRRPLGMVGMKERAEILGGKFSIISAEGSGTELIISLPVNS